MIRVHLERTAADRSIRSFRVEGHAFYAEPGKDIVCAGVSAVTVGTVNAVEALLGIELKSAMNKGLLQVDVPAIPEEGKRADVQLLLESMVVMLESVKQSYGEYITINEKFV